MCHHLSIFGLDSLYILHILTYYNYTDKELHELFNCSTCTWILYVYSISPEGLASGRGMPYLLSGTPPERF